MSALDRDALELVVRRSVRDAWSMSDVHVRAATERALLDAGLVTVDALWKDRGLQRLIREVVRDVRLERLERTCAALEARCKRLETSLAASRQAVLSVCEELDAGRLVARRLVAGVAA